MTDHSIRSIPPSRTGPTIRGIALTLVRLTPAAIGLVFLVATVATLRIPVSYHRDIAQDYLAGRAILAGEDPYQTVAVLTRRFFPTENDRFPFPTPHPPTILLVFVPFSALDYSIVFLVWQLAELLCLVISIRVLLLRLSSSASILTVTIVFGTAMLWYPIIEEIGNGQLMVPLLLLLVLAWRASDRGATRAAGIWLGLSLLVKPVLWPVVLFYAMRRQLRTVVAAAAVVAAGYAAALAVLGPNIIVEYVATVLPFVTAGHRLLSRNLSFWTIGWRLFHGTEQRAFGQLAESAVGAPPLIHAEGLALVVSIALPFLTLLTALILSYRRSLGTGIGIMTAACVLISPTTWNVYLVLLVVPAVIVVERIRSRGYPPAQTIATIALFATTVVPFWLLADLATGLIDSVRRSGGSDAESGLIGLVTLLPDVAVVGFGILAARWGGDAFDRSRAWRKGETNPGRRHAVAR